jgi:hypothetical protein
MPMMAGKDAQGTRLSAGRRRRMPGRIRTLTESQKYLTGDSSGEMADPERFERPTPRFVVWCSIQLSYGSVVGR